jgi:hypothetical protein
MPYTQVGDVVCIVPGHCLPLVLRPCGQQYKLVYACYVQGLMDGELVGNDMKEWLSSPEDIEIH